MKFGPLEGTEEEVNNLFQNNGLNLSEYIVKPDVPLKKIWLISPSTALVACFGVLTLSDSLSNSVKVFVFLLGFSASVWAAVSVHIRFKSAWGSGAVTLAGLLIMLVALGVISPVELLEYYKNSQEKA
jgi:hypothetical protein